MKIWKKSVTLWTGAAVILAFFSGDGVLSVVADGTVSGALGAQILNALNTMEKVAVDKMKKVGQLAAEAPSAAIAAVTPVKPASVINSTGSGDELLDKLNNVIESPDFRDQFKAFLGSFIRKMDGASVVASPAAANVVTVNKLGDGGGLKPDAKIVARKKTPGADRKYSTEDYLQPQPQKEIEVTSFQKIIKQKLKPGAASVVASEKPPKTLIVTKPEEPTVILAAKPAVSAVKISRGRRSGSAAAAVNRKRKVVKKLESPGPDHVKRIIISTNKSTPVQDTSADSNTEGLLRDVIKKLSKQNDEPEEDGETLPQAPIASSSAVPEAAAAVSPAPAASPATGRAFGAVASFPKAQPVDRPATPTASSKAPPVDIQNDEEPIISGNHGGLLERLKKIARLVPDLLNDAAKNGANAAGDAESAQYKPKVIRLQPNDEE